jgi:transcriptional regulator with XRE-family HTH domain
MAYSTEQIARALKAARLAKGLSQRALSELAAVPQSHISRIESGHVDLRISSLAEIARALDLEVTLVPRMHLSAVRSIIRPGSAGAEPRRPAYRLAEDDHG